MKKTKFLIPLAVTLLLSVFLFRGLFLNPQEIPSALIGKPVPAFDLKRLDAEGRVTRDALLGKVYLVNVWASWCSVCSAEHPLWEKFRNSGVRFTLVGYNYKDDPRAARSWLQSHGNPYDLILADPDGKTAIDFGVYGTPETFLIDKKGLIREKVIGLVSEEIWRERIAPLIKRLEAEP